MDVSVRAGVAGRGFAGRYVLAPAVRAVTGFPLALVALPLAVAGQGERAARRQVWLAQRFGSPEPGSGSGSSGAGSRTWARVSAARVIGHSLRVLIPSLVNFVLIGLVGFLTWSGYLYFLRPDALPALDHPFTPDRLFDTAWGGPTLAGAWLVHSLVALGMQVCCLAVIRWLAARQGRTTARLLA